MYFLHLFQDVVCGCILGNRYGHEWYALRDGIRFRVGVLAAVDGHVVAFVESVISNLLHAFRDDYFRDVTGICPDCTYVVRYLRHPAFKNHFGQALAVCQCAIIRTAIIT